MADEVVTSTNGDCVPLRGEELAAAQRATAVGWLRWCRSTLPLSEYEKARLDVAIEQVDGLADELRDLANMVESGKVFSAYEQLHDMADALDGSDS